MIDVAMGRNAGFEEEKLWMNRVLALQADLPEAYTRLFRAWLPRWGGKLQGILAVGLQAAATKAYDTGIPEFLLVALAAVDADLRSQKADPDPLWSDIQVWTAISILFNGYLAEPARARIRDWDRTRFAAYSWRCGVHDKAREILASIAGPIDADLFAAIAHESPEAARKDGRKPDKP